MNLLILTADHRTLKWETLDKKLAAVKLALNNGQNASFSVDIQYKSVIPKIDQDKDRIDTKWLSELTAPYFKEYDIVAFHFSKHQRNAWGIQPSLRGSNPKEDSELESLYFWSDEDTLRLGYSQFEETLLHEIAHSYFQQTKTEDITHDWHSTNKTIVGLFKTLDWGKYQPKRIALKKISFLQASILALKTALAKKRPVSLLHPVEKYKNYISQAYGVPNSLYKLTGRHIGTDYACPVGTEVLAPWDGKITTSGTSPATGNFCHYEYTFNSQKYEERWCHLKAVPVLDSYKRGDIVAVTGNTGLSTGPHLHREKWLNDVRVDLINKSNWSELTTDPEK